MFLRNSIMFIAMVLICAIVFLLAVHSLIQFKIQGKYGLILVSAVYALYGALGYFAFSGKTILRTWLVFFSVITFVALVTLLYDPGGNFYPLLISLPLASVAAVSAHMVGKHFQKREMTNPDAEQSF